MQFKNTISDMLDVASIIVAVVFSLMITTSVANYIDGLLYQWRGGTEIGSEVIFCGLILGGVTYIMFQLLTFILHALYEE